MERVQTFSQTLFPLPNGLTREDLGALRRAARLVAGERLPVGRGTANATFALANPEVFDKELTNDQFAVAFTDDSYTESIAGVDIPLDPRRWRSPAATIANREELLATGPWQAGAGGVGGLPASPGVQVEVLLVGDHAQAQPSAGTPGQT